MSWRDVERVTLDKDLQPMKASSHKYVTESGKSILVRALQFLNAWLPMVVAAPSVIVVSEVHSLKAWGPMMITDGMLTLSKELQPENAATLRTCTSGRLTVT